MGERVEEAGGTGEGDGVKEQAVCVRCFEPVDSRDYYCPKCGEASGQLTPYLPFINIRYNYSIFVRLWQKVWYEKCGLLMKAFSLFLIVCYVPIMLVGVPFVVWDKVVKRKKGAAAVKGEARE